MVIAASAAAITAYVMITQRRKIRKNLETDYGNEIK